MNKYLIVLCVLLVVTLISPVKVIAQKGVEKLLKLEDQAAIEGWKKTLDESIINDDILKDPVKRERFESARIHEAAPTADDVKKLLADFEKDGTYKPELKIVDVSPDVIESKLLPSPNNEQRDYYTQHADYMRKVYKLARAWRVTPGYKGEDNIKALVFNTLDWYFEHKKPARPYWRVTMRFGSYEGGGLGSPTLALIDRTLITMSPAINEAKTNNDAKRMILCRNLTDYTDNMVNMAVGAQNRGFNWTARFSHIVSHYVAKYICGDTDALNALKYHLQDGFEYDYDNRFTGGGGLLPDGGFWHHGPQPYCMPYAFGCYANSMSMLKRLENTPVEMEERHYEAFELQLLDKWQHVIYKDQWFDLSIVGGKNACQVVDYKGKVKPGKLEEMVDQMLELDHSKLQRLPEIKKLKQELVDHTHAKDLSLNKAFWHWEYMLHRRPGWYIGFKGISTRNNTPEWDQNFHLSSGHTAIMREGDEYWTIRPALTWTALPGVTAEQIDAKELMNSRGTGTSPFSNGVSDGKYGMYAFQCNIDNLRVASVQSKKAGFFFDRGLLALTCDIYQISETYGKDVWTTLNHCARKGEVRGNVNGKAVKYGKKSDIDDAFTLTKNSWFWHDGVGYIIPASKNKPVNIKLLAETRSGEIKKVLTKNAAGKMYEHDVFLLAINHGRSPKNQSCAYYVIPDASLDEISELTKNPPYQILSNNAICQAAYDPKIKLAECAFYQVGELDIPTMGKVDVKEAIMFMLEAKGDMLKVSAANPLQNKTSADRSIKVADDSKGRLRLNGKAIPVTYFSEKGYEGKTVMFEVEK